MQDLESVERPDESNDIQAQYVVHVSVRHGRGSVEHFHHFILGFFTPLICDVLINRRDKEFELYLVRSCGPLDRIMREIGGGRIRILDKEKHAEILDRYLRDKSWNSASVLYGCRPKKFITIYGNDYPQTYSKARFSLVHAEIAKSDHVRAEMRSLPKCWFDERPKILLIQRRAAEAFYNSDRAEIKGAASSRRSIANHNDLYKEIYSKYPGCINVDLDGMSLAKQFCLFNTADFIIAQHGAALSNIIWVNRSATVVEIFPSSMGPDQKEEDFFFNLSRCMGVRYKRIWQDHEHSDVDIASVMSLLECIVGSREPAILPKLRSVQFILHKWTIPFTRRVARLGRRVRQRITQFSSGA